MASTHLRGQAVKEHHEHAGEHTLPAKLPGPIVDTHELMDLFNRPLYELLRAEMQKDLGGQTQWDTIADRGLQAAEVMNLVAIREQPQGSRDEWMNHVRQAQQAGLTLARAANQHDAALTQDAYQALIQNCNVCHQTFAPQHAPELEP
jgi:hypothetical protein